MIVNYQPIVDLEERRVVRAEALCRLPLTSQAMIGTPAAFIASAERSGDIRDFTQWMLSTALADRAQWGADVGVAINLSFANLFESDFAERVFDVLGRFDADPAMLTFELNDGIQHIEAGHGLDTMHRLAVRGVRFSIDGFGANLTRVSDLEVVRLPVGELKLDARMIEGLGPGRERQDIERVMRFARDEDLDVVAKCVENLEQLAAVGDVGCTFAQGFLFAPPLDAAAFGAWLGRPQDLAAAFEIPETPERELRLTS